MPWSLFLTFRVRGSHSSTSPRVGSAFHYKSGSSTLPNPNYFSSSSASKTQVLWSTCHQDIAICWSPGPLPLIPWKFKNLTHPLGYTTPAVLISSDFVILGNDSSHELASVSYRLISNHLVFQPTLVTYSHGDTLALVISNKCPPSEASVSCISHWSLSPLQQFLDWSRIFKLLTLSNFHCHYPSIFTFHTSQLKLFDSSL